MVNSLVRLVDIQIQNFKNVIDFVYERIGKQAFRNCNLTKTNNDFYAYKQSYHPTLTESVLLAVDSIINSKMIVHDDLRKKLNEILKDEAFQDILTHKTTYIENIINRKKRLIEVFSDKNE